MALSTFCGKKACHLKNETALNSKHSVTESARLSHFIL